jgi:transcriptional regulator with XRE-family HTH domain
VRSNLTNVGVTMAVDVAPGSTVPRRTLGRGLREARESAGLPLEAAAEALDCSRQKVWRIEKGAVPVTVPDVRTLCTLYDLSGDVSEAFIALAKETKAKGWWASYGDVLPRWFEPYVGMEQSASRIRTYEPALIPGLLQADGYMGAVIRVDRPELETVEVEKRIALRKSRQGLLTRAFPAPPHLDVLLAEAAVRVESGGLDVMGRQVWHLLKATELPNVTVRIVPLAVGPHPASVAGAFTLLDFPGGNGDRPDPATVYSENLTGALYLDKPTEIEAYERVWDSIRDVALTESESIDMLGEILKGLNDRV